MLFSNSIDGFIHTSLTYIIEGHYRICIMLLFMIGFNACNVYALLYCALAYGGIYICIYLV